MRSEFADVAILANYGVAFAGSFFEFLAIQDFYGAAVVLDNLALLQDTGSEADARPVRAEHGGQEIVGDGEDLGVNTILSHQEPASEALLDAVEAIARSRLRDL